jgi:hypothetical protein
VLTLLLLLLLLSLLLLPLLSLLLLLLLLCCTECGGHCAHPSAHQGVAYTACPVLPRCIALRIHSQIQGFPPDMFFATQLNTHIPFCVHVSCRQTTTQSISMCQSSCCLSTTPAAWAGRTAHTRQQQQQQQLPAAAAAGRSSDAPATGAVQQWELAAVLVVRRLLGVT